MKYLVGFHGKKKGALGRQCPLHNVVEIDDNSTNTDRDVRMALYEGKTKDGQAYDHIINVSYMEV